jgi:hypothetical protein
MITKMKNHKLILTFSIIGILTAASAFSQGTEPHVPFSELDPSKNYANEAEYIKAVQEMGSKSNTQEQNTPPAAKQQKNAQAAGETNTNPENRQDDHINKGNKNSIKQEEPNEESETPSPKK